MNRASIFKRAAGPAEIDGSVRVGLSTYEGATGNAVLTARWEEAKASMAEIAGHQFRARGLQLRWVVNGESEMAQAVA